MDSRAAYVTTSWDDGHPLDMRLAELLSKYDLPGTFYVPWRSERPVLDRARIRELAARFEIGAHTMRHADLRACTPEAARTEIGDSKRYIEDLTGVPCAVLAPPGGRYRQSHLALVREAGYRGMRTVELMSLGHARPRSGIAVIPTSLQIYPHTAAAYLRNAAKRCSAGNLFTYFAHAHGKDLHPAAEALVAKVAAEGGVFHLWGHSWEIEEMGLWPTLERILMTLHAAKGRCRMVSNAALCEETRQYEPAARTA